MSIDWQRFKAAQYGYVTGNRSPCLDGYINQCALRVSNSLVDAGWPFDAPGQPYSSDRFGPLCTHGFARGARSLSDYLEVYLARPKRHVVPVHPETRQLEVNEVGEYFQLPDGSWRFYPLLKFLEAKSTIGHILRGVMFFDNPEHIDLFDFYEPRINTSSYGIVGEEYVSSCSEVRCHFI